MSDAIYRYMTRLSFLFCIAVWNRPEAGKTNVKFERRKVTNFHLVLIGLQSRWFKSSDLRTRRTAWGKRARLNYALNGLFSRACVLPRRRSYLKNGFLLYFHHSARIAYHATLRRHRLPQACVDEACITFAIYTSPFNGAARLITAAITFAIQFNSISFKLATKTIVRTLVFTDVLTELT